MTKTSNSPNEGAVASFCLFVTIKIRYKDYLTQGCWSYPAFTQ